MPDTSDTPRVIHASWSEARAVLVLLGFHGVLDFSKRAGINHGTASSLLYKMTGNHHFPSVMKAYSAMHEAYQERKATASKAQREYIKDFAARWLSQAMDDVEFEVPAAWRTKEKEYEVQRLRRQDKVRAAAWLAVKSLKWE